VLAHWPSLSRRASLEARPAATPLLLPTCIEHCRQQKHEPSCRRSSFSEAACRLGSLEVRPQRCRHPPLPHPTLILPPLRSRARATVPQIRAGRGSKGPMTVGERVTRRSAPRSSLPRGAARPTGRCRVTAAAPRRCAHALKRFNVSTEFRSRHSYSASLSLRGFLSSGRRI